MVNLFQRIMNKNTVPTDNELDLLVYGKQPKIDTTSQEFLENMGYNTPKQTFGNKLAEALLGKQAEPTDNISGSNGAFNITTSETPRTGGILRDIASGYRENRDNAFSLDNWNGEKKNAAQRIGEILGTGARIIDSPLGRGLVAYGASNMIGDTNPLEQALTATVKNKNLKTNDRIFRNDLIETQKQALMNSPEFNALSEAEKQQVLNNLHNDQNYMGLSQEEAKGLNTQQYRDTLQRKQDQMKQNAFDNYLANRQQNALRDIENKVNGLRGYVTPETYKLLTNSQLVRDNAAYKKMYYDNQQEQNKIMNALRQDQLNFNKDKEAFDQEIALGNLAVARQNANTNAYKATHPDNGVNFNGVTTLRKEFASLAPVKNATEISRQYNNVVSLYEQYKNKKISRNSFDQALITTLNKVLDPTSVVRESEFDRTSAGQATWDKLTGYSQKLTKGGSGLTDANRADLVQALTTMKNANDNEVRNIVDDYSDLAVRYGINPADIMPRHYRSNNGTQAGNTSKFAEGTIIKNKQGQRMIMRGGKWQTL